MKRVILPAIVLACFALTWYPSLGFAGTRYGLVEFAYQGNSYYTPRDFCMVFFLTNPDSVAASGRILERNGFYYFEFEITDQDEFVPGNVHNYIKIWAYTDSIHESRYITPLLPCFGEVSLRFYFGAYPNCYGIGSSGGPGGP